MAAARGFEKYAKELDGAAREWEPTTDDALTALVVMTPTMSEYFEAWKNSRFIAGDKATEKAFVVASRLQDIADILGGLVLVYDNVEPVVAKADEQQAQQTKESLGKLHGFAADAARQGGGRAQVHAPRRPTRSDRRRRSAPRRSRARSPRRQRSSTSRSKRAEPGCAAPSC